MNQGQSSDLEIPEDVTDILRNLQLYTYSSIEVYQEQITSNDVLRATIEALDLDMTIDQLSHKIEVTNPTANLMVVTVTDQDAKLTADIVNTLTDVFQEYLLDLQMERLNTATQLLTTQLATEEDNLDQALSDLKVLLEASRDSVAIQSEITISRNAMNTYKERLATLDITYENDQFTYQERIRKNQALIESYGLLLESIDPTFELEKSVLEDPFTENLASEVADSIEALANIKMTDEEVNPVYVETLQKLIDEEMSLLQNVEQLTTIENTYQYNLDSLEDTIDALQTTIDDLRIELADREIEERIINRRVDSAQNTVDAFADKLELTRIAEASNASSDNIVVVSSAMTPATPTGPNRLLYLAIGVVLGGMVGVMSAFLKEYWISTDPKNVNS